MTTPSLTDRRGTISPPVLPTPNPSKTRAQTTEALAAPIDPRHLREHDKGKLTLKYFPWAVLTKCLHARTNSWSWELLEVKTLGEWVVVSGRLTVDCSDGQLTYEAVSSEPIQGSFAPPIETAASSCVRRACALAGLGTNLWLD